MIKKLLLLLAAVSLTGLLAVQAPASADIDDNYGLSACYEQRVQWTSQSTVTHAHLSEIGPNWVYLKYHCCLDVGGLSHRWNFSAYWANGATSSEQWSPVYGGWCP